MLNADEIKRRVSIDTILHHYRSVQDREGRWQCPFPERHRNGDAHYSVTVKDGRAKCWSQNCFGEKGADVFELVGIIENLPNFTDQKRRVLEIGGIMDTGHRNERRQIIRRHHWRDAKGYEAWHLRWEPGEPKFTWAQDPEGKIPGRGQCRPTLYGCYPSDAETDSESAEAEPVNSVILVEGERDADTVNDWLGTLGIQTMAATTTPNGAGDVKAEFFEGKMDGIATVYLSGDNDPPGQGYVRECGKQLKGSIKDLRSLAVPEGFKDWTEWAEAGGTAEQFRLLLEKAKPFVFMSPSKNGTLHEREFAPLAVGDFLDLGEGDETVSWVLEDYLPVGGLTLLAGKPKEGKTTLTYELAVRVAQGEPFLNRQTCGGGVLILALEEHARDVRIRLRTLGAERLSLYVLARPLEYSPDIFEGIRGFIAGNAIRLVLIDTLGAFWDVRDENDAAEVTRAIKPLLSIARETGACILLIHHARKSEGSHGDEIRGSGALFAAVDVALILKRHEIQTHRVLQALSRYPDTPAEMVLDLTDTGYIALGDPASLNRQARREKVKAALTSELEDSKTISKQSGVSIRDTHRLLKALFESGEAFRGGKGAKGSPFRYRSNSIHATPPVLGIPPHETNSERDEFDSCNPSSSCANENPETSKNGPYPVGATIRFQMGLGEESGTVERHDTWAQYPGEVCYVVKGRTIPHSRVLGVER
jgi:hypothetical protein